MTYKIFNTDGYYTIQHGEKVFPCKESNSSYQRFIQDVAEQGIDIVEGPDVVEPSYAELRTSEYPSREEQFDMMYWDGVNGTTTWQDLIASIKDRHPKTITGGTTIGEVPAWVQEAASNWTFNKQLREYVEAIERLSQYVLAEGRPELTEDIVTSTEEVWNEETEEYDTVTTTETVVTQTAIDALPETIEITETDLETEESTTTIVPNPIIVKDEEERAAAQATIDATPQGVIDSL